MKTKMLLMCIMYAFLIVIGISCKDDTNKKDCGCDSDNKTYVTGQTGTLQKDSLHGDFYIEQRQAGAIYSSSTVCNPDKVKNITPGRNVTYSGYRSVPCIASNQEQIYISLITIDQIRISQ